MTITSPQKVSLANVLLAYLEDQEEYFKTGNMELDRGAAELNAKIDTVRDIADFAYANGMDSVASGFYSFVQEMLQAGSENRK
jgi:hypothetical protein